jgi:hypothetical protein
MKNKKFTSINTNTHLLLYENDSLMIKRFFASPPAGGFAQNDSGLGGNWDSRQAAALPAYCPPQ